MGRLAGKVAILTGAAGGARPQPDLQLPGGQACHSRHGPGRGWAIVNTSSIMGQGGWRTIPALGYSVAKGGVVALTRVLAAQHGVDGIRVNCLCPGIINRPRRPLSGELARWWEERVPLGRVGRPEDVARLALWLCSDEASYVSGAVIPVDGGILAQFGG